MKITRHPCNSPRNPILGLPKRCKTLDPTFTHLNLGDFNSLLASHFFAWGHAFEGYNFSNAFNLPVYLPASANGLQARYIQLSVTDNDGTPPCVSELRAFAPAPHTAIRYRGADLSFEAQEEAAGAHFTDNGAPASALQILNNHRLNYVRLRLWVNPPPGYSNLASDLAMARRIKRAGDRLYLDIHYSDFWADPQHQDIPAAWRGQDLAQLTDTVRSYTQQVIRAFLERPPSLRFREG